MADTLSDQLEVEESNTTTTMPLHSSVSNELLQQHDEDSKNHDSGEEYSSGSDRSMEADIADESKCDDNNSNGVDGVAPAKIRSKKRRHGSHSSRRQKKGGSRHKTRSFHPYPDAGDLENSLKRKSLEIQEKENAAAVLRREGGSADPFITFPVAPFNSTQFLMDEHNSCSPKSLSKHSSPKIASHDVALSSMPSTPRNDPDDFGVLINLNKKDDEFSDIYTSIHAENLQSMPKEELVKHYMSLEDQVAYLQRKVAEAEQRSGDSEVERKDNYSRNGRKDSAPGSDTNSLSSGNEEFVDLSSVQSHSSSD